MSLFAVLDRSCTLQRQTAVKDQVGGTVPVFATVATFNGSVWGHRSFLERTFDRPELRGTDVICTDSDVDARALDRMTVSGESGYFIVEGTIKFHNASFSSETVYLIDCTKKTV